MEVWLLLLEINIGEGDWYNMDSNLLSVKNSVLPFAENMILHVRE